MATIETRNRSDGTTYRAKVRLRGHRTESATFRRLTDARRWAQATEAAIREGRYFKTVEAKRHTLRDLVDRYIREVVPTRPGNARNTTRMLEFWQKELGHLTLADVTPAVIAERRSRLLSGQTVRKSPRSPATVVRYLAALSHAYSIAMREWQWVEDSPLRRVSKPKEPPARCRFLDDAERRALLAACKASTSPHLYTVVVIALSTGMRRGEILSLQWRRVNLARGQIVLEKTKNGDRRNVPLTGHAHDLLTTASTVRRIDTELLFPGADPKKPVDVTRPWGTAVKRAKLEDFRFHDLRHTAASYLAMGGATTIELAAVLGHRTLQMVKRYAHLADPHTRAVVAAMNERMFSHGR